MSHSMSQDRGANEQQTLTGEGGVEVSIQELGPNQYRIVSRATFDQPVTKIWPVFRNFEKLVNVGLPGLTSDFEWLNGGTPDRVPSQFRFVSGGAYVVEEVYHRSDDEHVLRYRVLEPVLGILELDSELRLTPISDAQTAYTATRKITLEPGTIDGLGALVSLETQNMKNYFAKHT
jgi:hypothetical protein